MLLFAENGWSAKVFESATKAIEEPASKDSYTASFRSRSELEWGVQETKGNQIWELSEWVRLWSLIFDSVTRQAGVYTCATCYIM